MSEEIKTFIKRLKSDFHLDEIEKSLYFVNQKKILNKRLDTLNEKIADLNEKLGEPEKNNGGFKVRRKQARNAPKGVQWRSRNLQKSL